MYLVVELQLGGHRAQEVLQQWLEQRHAALDPEQVQLGVHHLARLRLAEGGLAPVERVLEVRDAHLVGLHDGEQAVHGVVQDAVQQPLCRVPAYGGVRLLFWVCGWV